MPQGDYQLDFTFKLKDDLPSSIIYKKKQHYPNPSAKVKYSLKVELDFEEGESWKNKQVLILREKPVEE